MSERAELADVLHCHRLPYGGLAGLTIMLDANAAHAAAELILDAGYRKPRTIADEYLCQQSDGSYLTDHKAGTIIESADGSVWRFDEGDWDCLDWASASLRGPATVLYEPTSTIKQATDVAPAA